MPLSAAKAKYYQDLAYLQRTGDRRSCGVLALALVCDVSARRAQNALAKAGRRKGRGTQRSQMEAAVKALGFEHKVMLKHDCTKAKTVKTLPGIIPKGRFLVNVKGHVLAVVDREICDWTENRLHRIRRIVRIEK